MHFLQSFKYFRNVCRRMIKKKVVAPYLIAVCVTVSQVHLYEALSCVCSGCINNVLMNRRTLYEMCA